MSVTVTSATPTIKQVFLYTWDTRRNRFTYSERDVVPTKIQIIKRLTYSKNKKGEFSIPDERLTIVSVSYPQYKPYTQLIKRTAKKQTMVSHEYNCIISLQKDKNKEFSMNSKIVWRVGSYKKFVKPPQRMVKMIYEETERELTKKFAKSKNRNAKQVKKAVEDWIKKNKRVAPYYSVGDYAAQVLGINLDNYYRIYPMQLKFNCLYGPPTQTEPSTHPYDRDIKYPFFDKHMIAIIFVLLKKNILKRSNYLKEVREGKHD